MITKLNPNEEDPVVLWAEIIRLQEELKGPDGFTSWRDAAMHERIQRVKAETLLKNLGDKYENKKID